MNEPFVLGWRTEGATRIELFTEAGPVPSASETMLAGELSDLRIAEDTEFVLRAHDGLGGYVEERLTVSVGAPEIERWSLHRLSWRRAGQWSCPGQCWAIRKGPRSA